MIRHASPLDSRPLAPNSTRKLEILGRDGDALGVNGRQVGVLEQSHEIGLARALQRHDGVRLELQVGLEVLRHLAHQTLERELAAEELGPLLVAADLAQGDGAGSVRKEMGEWCCGCCRWVSNKPVAMGLLHAASGGDGFACRLGGQGFAWRLAACGFACSLLRACHVDGGGFLCQGFY